MQILAITIPIYLLIGIGYLAGRRGLFSRDDMRVLGRFVVNFALPALLFRAIAGRPIAELADARYLAAYAGGSLATFALAVAVARARRRDRPGRAFFGMGMSFSNSGFVGFPIVSIWLGAAAAQALALSMLVENIVMLPIAIAWAEAGGGNSRWRQVAADSARGLARNPLILAIAAGLAFAALELSLPLPVARTIDLLAAAASAIGLFVIGGTLVGLRVRGMLGDVTLVAMGKLVLHPLAVAAALALLPGVGLELRAAAIAFAAMPMLSIYPILAQKYGHEGFCAATLLVTTVLSFATLSVTLWLLGSALLLPS